MSIYICYIKCELIVERKKIPSYIKECISKMTKIYVQQFPKRGAVFFLNHNIDCEGL